MSNWKTSWSIPAILWALVLFGCDEGPVAPALTPPSDVQAARNGAAVTLTWAPVAGAETYTVQRQAGADPFVELASGLGETRFTDASAGEGDYLYRVLAVRGADRAASDPVRVTFGPRRATLSGTIGGGEVRTLSADTVYLMQGAVVVDSGAVLRIPAGTTLLGDAAVRPTYLLVRQGGQIFAEGTAERPIVFTSSRPVGQRAPGDWGGVVIAGRSLCNFPAPCQVEGANARYGGSRLDDSSGVLRYLRIEFAGFEVSPGNELNALTLAGVGSGTLVEYVQVHQGSDDGIEWFGGTVDVRYALATGNDDDAFDYSSGWQGRGQFWIALQGETGGDKGFEVDGNETNFTATPLTDPQVYNVTLIGRGGTGTSGDAVQLRRGARGGIRNVVILGWGGAALDVDDAATAAHCTDSHRLMDYVIWFNAAEGPFDTDADAFEAACVGTSWRDLDPRLTAPLDRASPSFVPAAGSPALTGAATPPGDGFFQQVDFLGGVAPTGTPWYRGWTTFATR